jgi:hypothetical protein
MIGNRYPGSGSTPCALHERLFVDKFNVVS